ncbi:hypothetical protein HOLleu_42370 [Holothuria leucospilota]|uniref:Endonuclease/exonuclease/phosphatase domain-containing protein n=1 Tax=Holothuria leucospilota TaxID=206669 RepID=A0A9Q0YAX2_HOLLE|nr:hypothetical protein HOLleu_42370 [Holothuria leucospilota]
MAGDFNFVFNLKLDKVGGQLRTNFKARDKCLSLMTVHNLIDIWREKNPFSKRFTWSSNITPGIHCRLDFYLVFRSIEHSATDISFSPGIQSDHSFIYLTLNVASTKKDPGYWKLNNSLLSDSSYTDLINSVIQSEIDHRTSMDPCSRWEFLKFKLREVSIKYSKEKARERRHKEKVLLLKISNLEQQLFMTESAETRSLLTAAQNGLISYLDYKLQGTIIRSRARWVEDGEKNSKYFLSLEKRNKINNKISNLLKPNGDVVDNEETILQEIRNFYHSLYTSIKTFPDPFLHDLPHTSLEMEDATQCEGGAYS